MSIKKTGKINIQYNISVDIEDIIDCLRDKIANLVDAAIAKQTNNCDIHDSWLEDNSICIDGEYEIGYSSTYTPGTRLDPPEYDEQRDIDGLDADKICTYIKNNLASELNITEAIENLRVYVDEHEDSDNYTEDEPDWDMMPGGHDDY